MTQQTQATILIADDHPDGRRLPATLLKHKNYNIHFARDGAETIAMANEVIPDLILLDVMMPDIDGFEVCRRLRDDKLLGEVPIILVTALDSRQDILEGLKAGADDFISKPYDLQQLEARVETVIRLNRYRHIRTQRSRFQWVVDNARDGYLIIDREDRILYANPQARLYLSIPDNAEYPFKERFIPLARKQYQRKPKVNWSGWSTRELQVTQPRYLVRPETRSANALWLELSTHKQKDSVSDEILVQLRDVTQEMTAQRAMWSFQKLMGHKLRTPLIKMLYGLEMMVDMSSDMSKAEIVDLAKDALSGGNTLYAIVEDVMRYTNAPSLARQDNTCQVREVMKVLGSLREEVELDKLRVSFEAREDSLIPFSDTGLSWIFSELLENSKKFHPRNDPQIDVYVTEENGQVTVKVLDDGRRLSPQQLAQVWEPYYQGEKSFTGQVVGTGLGLPMVASMVWEVGGNCQIYNRTGARGVVVELTLPLVKQPARG